MPHVSLSKASAVKLQDQISQCLACDPEKCVGTRWVFEPTIRDIVRRRCPKGRVSVHPITVITPRIGRVTDIDTELIIRGKARELLGKARAIGLTTAELLPPDRAIFSRDWYSIDVIAFIGWWGVGLTERQTVALNDAIIRRYETGRRSIFTTAVHPSFIRPRWESDKIVLDILVNKAYTIIIPGGSPLNIVE